jgi:hypothetical protein
MKRLFLLFITVSLCLFNGISQSINYQAVARDSEGKELQNHNLIVQFTIFEGTSTIVWQETHETKTNRFGLFTLQIGNGEKVLGLYKNFSDINWGANPHSLQVEIKPEGNNNFINFGTTTMAYVPYALYALRSGNGGSGSSNISYNSETNELSVDSKVIANLSYLKESTTNITDIEIRGSNLIYTKNGQEFQLPLSMFLDNTDDQTLSISGQQLKLSKNDGTVSEVPLPKQILSVESNNILKLSNDGGSVTYDPSPLNEIQQISIKGDSLIIYRPSEPRPDGSVRLPDLYVKNDTLYLDAFSSPYQVSLRNDLTVLPNNKLSIYRGNIVNIDTDPSNEIQDLTLSGDTLSISKNSSSASKVSLHNDLTVLPNNKLTISRGDTVTIDTDATNEIQDLTLSNDILKITNNTSAKEIDLTPYKDNTDNQTLSYRSADTSIVISGISGSTTLNVANMVNVPWIGFSAIRTNDFEVYPQEEKKILWEIVEFNDNNCFSNTYNAFVAPQDGVYQINFGMKFGKNATELKVIKLNGTTETIIRQIYPENMENITGNILIKLNQSEQIYLIAKNNNSVGASNTLWITRATFSGYRIH